MPNHPGRRSVPAVTLALLALLGLTAPALADDYAPTEEQRTIRIYQGDRVFICAAPDEPKPEHLRRALARRSGEVAAASGGSSVARGRNVFLLTENFAASGESCGPMTSDDRRSLNTFLSINKSAEIIMQQRFGITPAPFTVAAGEGDCGLIVNLRSTEQPTSLIGYPRDSAACAAGVMSVVRLTPAPAP